MLSFYLPASFLFFVALVEIYGKRYRFAIVLAIWICKLSYLEDLELEMI